MTEVQGMLLVATLIWLSVLIPFGLVMYVTVRSLRPKKVPVRIVRNEERK